DPADTKPHTLDKTTGTRTAAYSYDAAGNTTSRPGPTAQQTLTWNTEGDLAKLTEGTKETGYLYDANGELLIRRAKGDGETVLYLGAGTELHVTTKGTTKTTSATRYYTANGQTIAVRTATAGVTGTKLSFLAADHHGTSSIALQAGTYALTKRYSTPFGAPRGTKPTTWPDDKAFLGKPADDTTALTHIGAREYDPTTGQFISVDPMLVLDQHQSLNGYAYANNTPVTMSDPSGMCMADACGYGVPKGRVVFDDDKPGEIITDGPVNPGNTGGNYCHHGKCGQTKYNKSGTAHKRNGGKSPSVGSGIQYECKYSGPGQQCLPVTGPGDSQSSVGNYISSLVHNVDFWSGLGDTLLGGFSAGGGVVLGASGVVECGTAVLCEVGVPSIAGGAGAVVFGKKMIDSGADKLGQAFREADGAASEGGASSAPDWIPKSATSKVPDSFGAGKATKKGIGWRWNDGKGNGVRIDQGNLNNSQVYQQVDHVVINSGGKILGRNGKPIEGDIKSNAYEAHIPLEEWLKWKSWNSPR
ncbi:RHS repeat domain-containing protein, partial [Streptomyces nogalater]